MTYVAKSISGHPLGGHKIVRIVYLDEAGISNPAQEPYLVVAGVIVDPDQNWIDLETYYFDLARDLFPGEDPCKIIFHAKDIWHGTGVFDRKDWPLQERMKIFRRLAQVPRIFDLPIVAGIIIRDAVRQQMREKSPDIPDRTIRFFTYAHAFVSAVASVDAWMKKNLPGEVAMLIAEDTTDVRQGIKAFHEGYTDRFDVEDFGQFRAEQIIDTVHYAEKDLSLLLQIADHCAFILKRRAAGCPHVEPYLREIWPQVVLDKTTYKGLVMSMPLDHIRKASD